MQDILKLKLNIEDIIYKRNEIYGKMIQSAGIRCGENFNALGLEDINYLFQLYDKVFFEGWFGKNFKGKLRFSLSKRMTRSAGLTICPKNIGRIRPEELVIEIRIGIDFFLQYGKFEGNKSVCGIWTENSLEALQLVLEHEICHVIEFLHFKKSNCRGERFKTLANSIFGHTERFHKLPTHKQIAGQKLGLSIGDTVSFSYKDKVVEGFLYNINKRATVMVRDSKGPLVDKKGNRYSKYYVPLERLE